MLDANYWTRRRFLAVSSAASAATMAGPRILAQAAKTTPDNVIPPPIVITGGIKPLFSGETARPLRYTPEDGDFVIRNGSEFFNRPLYGPISDFRVDAGDRPEFSLYLPGHGGNLKLGFITSRGSKWAADADSVVARYSGGRMLYDIQDAALGKGTLHLELLTAASGSGVLVKVEGRGLPPATTLTWAFGGVSGRKGRRNGDIGCEVEPVSKFFQLRPEECAGNVFSLPAGQAGKRPASLLHSDFCELSLTFPNGAQLAVTDFPAWSARPALRASNATSSTPILVGSVALGTAPVFLTLTMLKDGALPHDEDPAVAFALRSRNLASVAAMLRFDTPDPYLNAAAPAISLVAEALWDARQECVMHGCVAWRVALAGWRGPYILDATGDHERAKIHIRHWLHRQNISAVTTSDPATGPADPGMRLARKEGLLHSNGDLSGNHYDMNLVFFDVLLRHLRWTGDIAFAQEIWPALERHLAWERRLFRRTFPGKDGKALPLYEAYAAIWASDNLQYSGGGVAHSSAYNIFSFRMAATLARLLGHDPAPYETEAAAIHEAMQQLLWLPAQGAFAESKDLMEPRTVYNNPALWTVYHTIDSEVATPRQAWQMVAERLAVLPQIPIHGPGVPAGNWYMLACSDWLPYLWSLTLILLAENMHFALAMWQAGMADEAYRVAKGALLDSMYMGLCPGDLHMTSALDGHRQEAQRDFGDPAGMTSRALIEGLFGVQPDLINNSLRWRPGFPSDWNHASLNHRDFELAWHRDGLSETYDFTSSLPKQVPLTLVLPARTTSLPRVTCGARTVRCRFDPEGVGGPLLTLTLPAASSYRVVLQWHGDAPTAAPAAGRYLPGDKLVLPAGIAPTQIDDPQSALLHGCASAPGFHTVFARIEQGDCRYSLPISFEVKAAESAFSAVPVLPKGAHADPLDLSAVLAHDITTILERSYAEPRSSLCTLSIPDNLLGGWANIVPVAPKIDDAGLRAAGGLLKTPAGVGFRTPASGPNALLLSWFKPDSTAVTVPLSGYASGIYLLLTGTTLPQCSHMQHAVLSVDYADGTAATLSLRNPETWWPIEQDYMLDDYLQVDHAPPPPRVDLRTGQTRMLDYATFKGKGRNVPGGAATILYLPLDPSRTLASLQLEVHLYGIVVALLAATLVRPEGPNRKDRA